MSILSNKAISSALEGADPSNLAEVKRRAIYLPQETLVHLASQFIVHNAKNFKRSEVRKVEVSASKFEPIRPLPGGRKRKPKTISLLERASGSFREVMYEAEEALAEKGLHHQLVAVEQQAKRIDELADLSSSVNSNKVSRAKITLPTNVVLALEGTHVLDNMRNGIEEYNRAWDEDKALVDEININAEAQLGESLGAIISAYKESLHIEWTEELLDSEFALGDGTTVTWGDATVEQHEARALMFEGQAKAGIEGAVRHRKAIESIALANATSLRESV